MLFSKNHVKFAFILMIFAVLSVSVVSANDINSTDALMSDDNADVIELSDNLDEIKADGDTPEKQTPTVHINASKLTTGEEIEISLHDPNNGSSLINKDLTATINKKTHNLFTNDKGIARLKLDLPGNIYTLNVKFIGDNDYAPVSQNFDIKIYKIITKFEMGGTTLKNGEKLRAFLKDVYGNPLIDVPVSFMVDGNKYTYDTNSDGRAAYKVNLDIGKHSVTINYAGDGYYYPISKTLNIKVVRETSIVIGNSILLTNGHLRIYLKSSSLSDVANKVVKITINKKVYTKKTNSEGFLIFKPYQGKGKLNIKVEFAGTSNAAPSQATKQVTGIKGNPKNPMRSKIPLKNGVPNVDYMTWRYVMADGNMKYTLLKAQYKEVLNRDSYCLFLNKKLSKYTFFKSKAQPKYYHIIKREKWNVIERALNTKIVKKNKNGYWPYQVTASLKGKAYTYPEVRDVQDTGYTCGPTSCSMCSQVLRNYYCEKYLGQKAGSNSYSGSSTSGLKNALEKCNFKCSYFYQSSFNKALNQLKKGGCALVFHTWNHYVSILDISKDGKMVLVGNPSGDYDYGSHDIPTNWLSVSHMKGRFNDYDTSGLIVKLKYSLSKNTKKKLNNFYYNMGSKWTRQNVNERLVQIQDPFY